MKKLLIAAFLVASFYLFVSFSAFDVGFEEDGYSRSLQSGDAYKAYAVGMDSLTQKPIVSINFPDESCSRLSYASEPRVYRVNGKDMRFDSLCADYHVRTIVSAFSANPRLSSYFLNEERVHIVIDGKGVTFSTKNFEEAIENSENRYK